MFQIWRLSVKNLYLHPLRSMLTVLGIFIGVASVVWLLAISEGISRAAQKQIEDLGVTSVILPRRNEKDLVEVPPEVLEKLEIIPADTIDEVLQHSLVD